MKPLVIAIQRAVLHALGIALFVAWILSISQGDSYLKPFILLFLYTFAAVITWEALFCDGTLSFLEQGLRRPSRHVPIRYGLAIGILVCVMIWYGPLVNKAGYLRLFAPLIVSTMVCLLAPRKPIIFGIVAASCMAISSVVEGSRVDSPDYGIHWSNVLSNPGPQLFGWCVVSGMSLLVSIPIHFHRKAQAVTPAA